MSGDIVLQSRRDPWTGMADHLNTKAEIAATGAALPRTPTDYAHEFVDLLSHCYAGNQVDALRELDRLRKRFAADWYDPDVFDDYDDDDDDAEITRDPQEITDHDLIHHTLEDLESLLSGPPQFHAAITMIDALIFPINPNVQQHAMNLANEKGL